MSDPHPDCTCGACVSRRLWISENVINLDTMLTVESPYAALFTETGTITGAKPGVVVRRLCPQPCEHLSQEDAREGRTCAQHPCICERSEP